MANIVSLKDVYKHYCVTMDTQNDPSMLVHITKDKVYHFKSCGKGLFHMSLKAPDVVKVTDKVPKFGDKILNTLEITNKNEVTPYCFLSTVTVNKEYFTRNKIEGADRAYELQ